MSLQDELDRRREAIRVRLDGKDRVVLDAGLERLRMLQIREHALAEGDPFPDFVLPDPAGRLLRSDEILARGPMVAAFFRGGWCPYCDLAFRALEEVRPQIEAAGATLVGIVAERAEILARTAAEKALRFPLLIDEGGRLARLCGLLFDLMPEHAAFYERGGVDLPARQAGLTWSLPVPGTFLVRKDATVALAFADPDYTRRIEPEALLEAVRQLARPASRSG